MDREMRIRKYMQMYANQRNCSLLLALGGREGEPGPTLVTTQVRALRWPQILLPASPSQALPSRCPTPTGSLAM